MRVPIKLMIGMVNEEGQSLTEYALIILFVAIALVGALTLLGQNVGLLIQKVVAMFGL